MNKKIYVVIVMFAALLLAVFQFQFQAAGGDMEVVFFDVGQGDSHLIMTAGGQNILIDGGPDQTILEKLARYMPLTDRTIDLMVLTHPHADHVTGLVEVLKRYDVKRVLATGVVYTTDIYLEWLDEIKQQKIPFDHALAGKQYIFESDYTPATVTVIYPDKDLFSTQFDDVNESSVVLKLDYNQVSFLFTGDIGVENEARIVERGQNIKADVLKVPHQGSDTSASQEFIDAVGAQYGIIHVGENDYGHPSPRVIRRLERSGYQVLRTDVEGDVLFTVDAAGLIQRN